MSEEEYTYRSQEKKCHDGSYTKGWFILWAMQTKNMKR